MNPSIHISVITAVLLIVHTVDASAQAPVKQWDQRYGGTAVDVATAIAPAASGGYMLGGYSFSHAGADKSEPARGDADFWIVRIDANGNKSWDRRFGGTSDDRVEAITVAPDGNFVAVGYTLSQSGGDVSQDPRGGYDYWVVKVAQSGVKVWDRRFGGTSSDTASAVVPAHGDGYVIAGTTLSGATGDKTESSRGLFDFWVLKIDESGNKLWDRRFGGSDVDFATAVTTSGDGGYVIAGYSESGASGDKTEGTRGASDYWIVKINGDGDKIWDRRFGGDGADVATAIVRAAGGGYVVAGYSSSDNSGDKTEMSRGPVDFWLVKIDENGVKIWDRRFGGAGEDHAYAVSSVIDGGYIVAGSTTSPPGGDIGHAARGPTDMWLLKVDEAGNKVWDVRLGGDDEDAAYALRTGTDKSVMVAGYTRSGMSGDKSQTTQGEDDIWVVRLIEPQPTVQRWDVLQPIAGFSQNRWGLMSAWNLTTLQLQVSPAWQNGTSIWHHNANQYQQWIARFTYDQNTGNTQALAWYYRQIHIQ